MLICPQLARRIKGLEELSKALSNPSDPEVSLDRDHMAIECVFRNGR